MGANDYIADVVGKNNTENSVTLYLCFLSDEFYEVFFYNSFFVSIKV